MDFGIIKKRDDGTTIAVLRDEPLTMENNQVRPSNWNENKSLWRKLDQTPIFNHPFLLRNPLELDSINENEHLRRQRSTNQQTTRSSNNHQSNQAARISNNQ